MTLCKHCDEEIRQVWVGDEGWIYCDGCEMVEPDTYEVSDDNEPTATPDASVC